MIRVENVNVKPADMSGYRILISPSKVKRTHCKQWFMDLCPTKELLNRYVNLFNQSTHYYYVRKNNWYYKFENEYSKELSLNRNINKLIKVIKYYVSKVDIILLYDNKHNPLARMSTVALRDYIDYVLHISVHTDNTLHTMLYSDDLSGNETQMPLEAIWLKHHQSIMNTFDFRCHRKHIYRKDPRGQIYEPEFSMSHSEVLRQVKYISREYDFDFISYSEKMNPLSYKGFALRYAKKFAKHHTLRKIVSDLYMFGNYRIHLLPRTDVEKEDGLFNRSTVTHEKCGMTYDVSGESTKAGIVYNHWSHMMCPYCTRKAYNTVLYNKCNQKLGTKYIILSHMKDADLNHIKHGVTITHNYSHLVKILYVPKNYIYWTSVSSIFKGYGQYPLLKASLGERCVAKFLKSIHIRFIYGYTPKWLNGLHLDFYLPDFQSAIEYDGAQHFHPVKVFGGIKTFKQQQKHDKKKDMLCKAQGIKLYRIEDYNTVKNESEANRLIKSSLSSFIHKYESSHPVNHEAKSTNTHDDNKIQQSSSLNDTNNLYEYNLYEYSRAINQYIKQVRGYIHKRINNNQ